MAKLHELLAVEGDKQQTALAIIEEAKTTFTKKVEHFIAREKHYESFIDEPNEDVLEERTELTTTVEDKLKCVFESVNDLFDVSLQKEATNQVAVADLVVDGVTLGKDLPVTFLLGLETKLKFLRELFLTIPTLQNGVKWEKDDGMGENIYRISSPQKKFRTRKTFQHKVLYEATDKHPAQIKEWEETENIGIYVETFWSGMISSAEKSALLNRVGKLLQSVRRARQRANSQDVVERKIGKDIMDYLLI